MSGYVSKDFIHEGCGLPLNPEFVWENVPYSVQKNIKKAEKNNLVVKYVKGNQADLEVLRSMWYDPQDPNFPNMLAEEDEMFIAYNSKGIAVGAMILLPVGNHLFLNNLAGNSEGKKLRVQDFLLWHAVNYFKDSKYKYIDVGVSYRSSLYNFFKKWKVISYPVLFNKPEIPFSAKLKPFVASIFQEPNYELEQDSVNRIKRLSNCDEITFVPNGKYAKKIMKEVVKKVSEKTYDFPYEYKAEPYFVDLSKIFSVQFGAVIFGIKVDDKDMWNKYACLDVYKRSFVYSAIHSELTNLDKIIDTRQEKFSKFVDYFELESIYPNIKDERIRSAFYFSHELNDRYHSKLLEFDIEHYYNKENNEIGLPVHQNISDYQIKYIYAVFRGVLNLCSEWTHTDVYGNYKS